MHFTSALNEPPTISSYTSGSSSFLHLQSSLTSLWPRRALFHTAQKKAINFKQVLGDVVVTDHSHCGTTVSWSSNFRSSDLLLRLKLLKIQTSNPETPKSQKPCKP